MTSGRVDLARGSLEDGKPPMTSDGRYIAVRGRLWHASNPNLPEDRRKALVNDPMDARRSVATARRSDDAVAESVAHAAVEAAKVALGERCTSWWFDGAPDLNRKKAKNTHYADSYEALATPPVRGS